MHQPVLLEEVLEALNLHPAGIYMDCTFGRGGHSRAILARIGAEGHVLALDRDPQAVAEGRRLEALEPRFRIRRAAFSALREEAEQLGVIGRVNGLLFDLGASSPQFDTPERGFSFRQDGPLDMRMDPDQGESAAQWLNRAREEDIVRVLKEYGEERFAGRIARAIVRARKENPLTTTTELADLVASVVPGREPGKHPATRTFQAIRIRTNREQEELDTVLSQVLDVLAVGGRLAVISFHSLEDRRVKRFIRDQSRGDPYPRGLPVPDSARYPRLRTVGRAVRPGVREVSENPRSRSAVLRVAEKLC